MKCLNIFLLLNLFVFCYQVDAQCTASRVRKSYDRMTYDERLLYRDALKLAMDKGYYIKFVEMHTETMSEMQAHRMCMFIYWHRFFLLGFENMLRSLGPQYACITVPYWDLMQQSARHMAGHCKNVLQCAPIVRDLGGSTSGVYNRGITINGGYVSGDRCVDRTPLNHFCESSSKTGTACAKCLPRGNYLSTSFPGTSSFASVYRQLFTPPDVVSTGKSIEEGVHNSIHAILGGAMGTFQSPADPLFWSHHAYIDLLMTIYLKCRVGGLGILSPAQKGNNKYTFAKCPYRGNTGFFTTESELVMRFGENGINPKQVNQPGQVMYPFFQTIPRRYFELSDITTIQGNSYKYQVTGLVGQMFTKCEGSSTISRRLEEVKPKRRVSCGVRGAQQEAIPNEVINATNYAPQYYTSGQSEKEHEQAAYDPAQNFFPIFWDKNHQESIVIDEQATVQVTAWADEVKSHLQSAKLNHTEAVSSFSGSAPSEYGSSQLEHEEAHELEKMVCMFYDQCRGGVKDYTEEFKKSFGVKGPPPCKRIVDEIKSGLNNGLKLSNWKELMEKYFPCNVSIDQTSYIGADLPDSENENDEAGSGLMDSSSAESDYTVNDDSTFEDEDEDEFVVSKVPGENTTELVPQPSAAFNTILPNGSAIPDMPSTSPIPLRIDTSPSPVSASASGSGVGSVESPSTNSN